MTDFPKVTTVDTNNLHPGEIVHVDFAFYKFDFHTWIQFHAHCFLYKD